MSIDPYKRLPAQTPTPPPTDASTLALVEREARGATPPDVVALSRAWRRRRPAEGRISELRPAEVLAPSPARRLDAQVPASTALTVRNLCRAQRELLSPSRLPFATWHADTVFIVALVPLVLILAIALAALAAPDNPALSLSSVWFALAVYLGVVVVVLGIVVAALGARARSLWVGHIASAANALLDAMTACTDTTLSPQDREALAEPWSGVFAGHR